LGRATPAQTPPSSHQLRKSYHEEEIKIDITKEE